MGSSISDGPWSDLENAVVVAEYMAMLDCEVHGRSYVKTDHNRAVRETVARSKGSVEFKFCNVSAVLQDMGLTWLYGYAPRSNYQTSLRHEVERFLKMVGASVPQEDIELSALEGTLSFESLWQRATGGTATADSPTQEESPWWPVGPGPAGADEAVSWLRGRLDSGDLIEPTLVFLVGGPGNGKSALGRRLVSDMQMEGDPDTNLAHRMYDFRTAQGQRVSLLNDATMPGPEGAKAGLRGDIATVLRGGDVLLANINRGILQEEGNLAAADGGDQFDLASHELVKWLAHVAATHGENAAGDVKPISRWQDGADEVVAISAIAVLMDVTSLLEERPHATTSDALELSNYNVRRITKRGEMDRSSVPAAEVLASFLGRLDAEVFDGPLWDPIAANARALQSEVWRDGLLTTIRAAELVSSRRLSYRELWGAFVRAVAGDLPERMRADEARLWLAAPLAAESEVRERFAGLAELARLRTHQALVGAASFGQDRRLAAAENARNPVLRLMSRVDPALDVTPDWSGPVLAALSFPDDHHSPLRSLLDGPDGYRLTGAVTPFDHLLDDAYVAWMAELDDARDSVARKRAASWYGTYLLRLYAIATARPAFLTELDRLTEAWKGTAWPGDVKTALRTLLFPRLQKDSNMMLPVLEARAHPVVGLPDSPRLVRVIESNETKFDKVRRGEALFVEIDAGAGTKAQLEFDFDLLREALACVDGELGVSDRARATLPRLERFRANLLRPDLDLSYAIVSQSGERILELDPT